MQSHTVAPVYDPFWAAAEEAGLPVTLHIVTGQVRDPFTYHGAKEREKFRVLHRAFREAAPVLANEFIFGGIFDRFPKLKMFLSEYDASWLPILKYRVDRIERFPGFDHLKKKPASRYVEENIVVGIINDPLAAKLRPRSVSIASCGAPISRIRHARIRHTTRTHRRQSGPVHVAGTRSATAIVSGNVTPPLRHRHRGRL